MQNLAERQRRQVWRRGAAFAALTIMAAAVGIVVLPGHAEAGPSQGAPATSRPTSRPAAKAASNAATKPTSATKPPARAASKAPASRPAQRPVSSTPKPTARPRLRRRKRRYTGRMKRGIEFISKRLSGFLMKHGRDPDNPWLLAHALLAFGKDLKLADGTYAIDRIVSGYLKFRKAGKRMVSYFPKSKQKTRVEPHPYMHLKTFLELGVPLTRTFKVGTRSITLKQMLDDAIYTFPATPKGGAFGPLAWRMYALYGRRPKGQWMWPNAKGYTVNFFRILFRAFKYTNKQVNFLRIMKANGVKKIIKRKQYIYNEACGGFHLLQSTLRWMGHPDLQRHTKSALNTHKELIFYRLRGETRLYLSMFKQYQKNPAYRFLILLQQLKFLGHTLETLVKLNKWGLFTPSRDERLEIRRATRLLLVTVMLIDRLGFYRGIARLKKSTYQFYLDLLGDSAHALHALHMIKNTNLYRP